MYEAMYGLSTTALKDMVGGVGMWLFVGVRLYMLM